MTSDINVYVEVAGAVQRASAAGELDVASPQDDVSSQQRLLKCSRSQQVLPCFNPQATTKKNQGRAPAERNLSWTFRIFFIFFARGRGRGVRGARKGGGGGVRSLLKIPQGGGGPPGEGAGAGVRRAGGCLRGFGGGEG